MTSIVFDCKVPNAIPQEGHGLIYLYTFDNGMMYVGQTIKSVKHRHNGHRRNNQLVDNYIRTHSFRLEIIGKYPIQELDYQERYFIKELNTIYPNGFNFDSGGSTSKEFSQELKLKLREIWKDEDYRKRVIAKRKEVLGTPEAREQSSKRMKEMLKDPKMRKKWSDSHKGMKGHPNSEEVKGKLKEGFFKMWNDPVRREQLCEERRNRKTKESTKLLLSQKSKTMWSDPQFKEKMKEKHRISQNNPEVNARRSESLKKTWAERKARQGDIQ